MKAELKSALTKCGGVSATPLLVMATVHGEVTMQELCVVNLDTSQYVRIT